jgi:hypothetical protein
VKLCTYHFYGDTMPHMARNFKTYLLNIPGQSRFLLISDVSLMSSK